VRADLRLVGAWPDRGYERSIRAQVRAGGLSEQVVFAGHVPRGQLHRDYAESRVFCLMSRCESFGIPAVEAQAFGTPVVGSDCCAIPEICGAGGVYPRPGDWAETARQLASLLTDDRRWSELSGKARANAQRFRWDACSRGLLEMFEGVSADGP